MAGVGDDGGPDTDKRDESEGAVASGCLALVAPTRESVLTANVRESSPLERVGLVWTARRGDELADPVRSAAYIWVAESPGIGRGLGASPSVVRGLAM